MQGHVAFALAGAALAWCLALLVLLPPAFSAGDDWLVPLAIPPLLAGGAFLAMRRRCHTGSGRARAVSGLLVGLLLAYSVITGFSIGMAIMPAALALLAAHAVVPSPR